jgi:gliding motility-associated-like protein
MRIILQLLFLAITSFFTSGVNAQKDTLFWFAAPEVSSSVGDTPVYLRFLTYNSAAVVTVSQPANGGFIPIILTITANNVDSIDLSAFLSSVESPAANIIAQNGLKISSTALISAFYELKAPMNREVFSLKGQKALGEDFYTPFQKFWNNGTTTPASFSSIEIVATENNTTVLVTPKTAITGHPANVTFSLLLNAGQTYSARDMNITAGTTLAGSIVSSNKPVAVTVFTGAASNAGCTTPMGDQITSREFIGTDYIIRRGNTEDRVYILATQNSTGLTLSNSAGSTSTLINFSETYEYVLTDSVHYIKSTQPVYIWHVSGYGCRVNGAQVPNIICSGTYSTAFTRTNSDSLALILYARSGYESQFAINGNSSLIPASAFAPVPGTLGQYKAALIYFSLADIPLNSYNNVTNTADIFGLGVLSGSSTNGSNYAYFSEFTSYPFVYAGTDDTTCANVAFPLNGMVGGGSVEGNWTTNGFGSFQNASTSVINSYIPSPLDTLVSPIRLILTSTGSCNVQRDTLMLVVNPAPIVNASADQTVCANNAMVQLNGAVSGGASTGTWTTLGSGNFIPDPVTLDAEYVPSQADKTAGLVRLVLTSTNFGSCNAVTDTMSVSITQPPVVEAGEDTLVVCYNNPDVVLAGVVSGASATGKWITTGNGLFTPNNQDLNATYEPSVNDLNNESVLIYLESTNNGNCVPVQDSVLIQFTSAPTVNAGPNIISCTNDPEVTLAGAIGGSATSAIWSGGNGTFTPDNTSLDATYTATASEISSGNVILVLTTTNNGGCNAVNDNIQISFVAPPFANFNFTDACLNTASTFTDFSLPGFGNINTWEWNFDNGQTSSIQNPTQLYTSPGTYDVQLITSTNTGCTDTVIKEVTVFELPAAGFSYVITCTSTNVLINFMDESTSTDPINYWFYDFGGQGNIASEDPSQIFVGDGNFIISHIVETVNGCRDTSIITINIPPRPQAGFSFNTNNGLNIGAVFNFVDTSSYVNSWYWTFGNGNSSEEQNPSNTYFSNGSYVVTQYVTGDLGCTDSASTTIIISTVTNEITTLIPNAISPNGDGKNDVWKLGFINLLYASAKVTVYNQWGQELFYSEGYEIPWDGTYQAEAVPDGTYFYVIDLNDNSEDRIYKGALLVLKNGK